MRHPNKLSQRGITILEILIALGVLVVILSFATPSLSNATAKAELKAAVENMEYSIHIARSTARQMNTDVIMHFDNDRKSRNHSIWYTIPARQSADNGEVMLQPYQFSESIRLVTNETKVRFDFRGAVETPVQLVLVAQQDADVTQRLLIQ